MENEISLAWNRIRRTDKLVYWVHSGINEAINGLKNKQSYF
jgi:hypothetical protein